MTMQHNRIHQDSGRSVSLKRLLGATAALPAAIAGLMMAFAAETPANAHDYTISPTVFRVPGVYHRDAVRRVLLLRHDSFVGQSHALW